ncbi:hypothetical protein SeMB42_g06550 [Synchytrium endobioticum]|nr:hypothetical protein SeMB42_g06550 [Synchytrium endobioticum]
MQKQRQDQVQDTPTELQSINLVRNLLNTTVGAITYLRVIFAEDHYKDTNVNGMSLKSLERGHSKEADDLIDWLECGVFDALEKKYLRTLIFGIYTTPDEPEKLMESYTFNFSYPTDGQFHVSFVTDGKQAVHFRTKKEIMKATSEMLRRLLTLTQNLSPLPDNPNITMKIYYYDEVTPEDYEPPYFVASDHTKPYYFGRKPEKLVIGNVETAYHALNLRLQYASEDPDGDEPMERAASGHFMLEEEESSAAQENPGKNDVARLGNSDIAKVVVKTEPLAKVFPTAKPLDNSKNEGDSHMPPPVFKKQPLMPTLDTNLSSDQRLPLPQFTPISTLGSTGTQDLIMELRAGTEREQQQVPEATDRPPSRSLSADENMMNRDMEDIESNYSDPTHNHNSHYRRPQPSSSPRQYPDHKDISKAKQAALDIDMNTYQEGETRNRLYLMNANNNGSNTQMMMDGLLERQQHVSAVVESKTELRGAISKEKGMPTTTSKPNPQAALKSQARNPHSRAYASEVDPAHVSCACGHAHAHGAMIECTKCFMWSHATCFGFINQEDAFKSTDAITCYKCQHGGSSTTFKKCVQITRFRRALMLIWDANGCESISWLSSSLGMEEASALFILDKLKNEGIIRAKARPVRGRLPKKCWPYELVSDVETLSLRDYYMGADAWKDSSILMEDTTTTTIAVRRHPSARLSGREGKNSKGGVIVPPTPILFQEQQQEQENLVQDAMDVDEDEIKKTAGQQKRGLSHDAPDDDGEGVVRSSTKVDLNTGKRRKVSVATRPNRVDKSVN